MIEASWQQDGRGLGATPPENRPQLEPATGKPDYSQLEPDTSGVPPQAVQSGPGGGPGGGSAIPGVDIVFAGVLYDCTVNGTINGPV